MRNIVSAALLLVLFIAASVEAGSYAIARTATPVLNSAEFGKVFGGKDGKSLKTDRCGQVREMEFVALPGTVFQVTGELRSGKNIIYQVETDEYPAPAGITLYVDSRFLEFSQEVPQARKRSLPSKQEIVSLMRSAGGIPYVWGGNQRQGVRELLNFYYKGHFAEKDAKRLTLAGLDCSGLLYEATNGWTPRNTSALIRFGEGVPVAGKSVLEIVALLEPLDLIVWNGHVLIVLDRETIIESRLECGRPGNGGVIVSSLKQRLAGIMKTRQPADAWGAGSKKRDQFVVRRWFPI